MKKLMITKSVLLALCLTTMVGAISASETEVVSVIQTKSVQANKKIHVAKNGNDNGTGSLENPYLTIFKASIYAGPGDTVFIHEGTYEETITPFQSGQAGSPVVYQSYGNDKVVISAMQALSGWTNDAGSVYKTTVSWDLGQQNFVMNGTTALDLARWPNNTDGEPFTLDSRRNTSGSAGDVITDAWLGDVNIPNFDWSKGGSVFFFGDKAGSGWTAWKSFIKSSSAGKVTFDLAKNPEWIRTYHAPGDKGDYFLEGIKEALDYQNEWYFDGSTKTLFVQLPNGVAPADGMVKMRKRALCVDLNGKNYVEIRNLAVFGGSIEISGGYNKIFGVTSLYGNMNRGVVTGFSINSNAVNIKYGANNNIIEQCEIGYGSGSGIWDAGNGTLIKNNYIHDFNYVGCYDAVMMARGGAGTVISNNLIKRGGRDCIQIVSKGSEVAYNDISQSNLIADDCGLLYTIGAGLNMKIHHNWFHDTKGRGTLKKAAGIYLDNSAADVSVHHNAIWNITTWPAIQINWSGTNIDINHNTMWNVQAEMGAWHNTGTAFTNVMAWNNLSNRGIYDSQTSQRNNYLWQLPTNPFVNLAGGNFNLVAGSAPIDKGRSTSLFDGSTLTGYTGSAPDAGAYEYGGEAWKAGVNWDVLTGPTGRGCYGLPGEKCIDTATEIVHSDKKSGELLVYPNPVRVSDQFLTIKGMAANDEWQIFGVNGCLAKAGKANGKSSVLVGDLKPGMYLISVKSNGEIVNSKFVKL